MSPGFYLEHYLDSLEHLPIELQRNFTLMRDLDTRAQSLMRNIDSLAEQYLRGVTTGSAIDVRKQQMDGIQQHFNKAKEYGDDKVQLAIQTYELVDKHIRRLDSDLAKFEAEIQDKALSTSTVEDAPPHKRGRKKTKEVKESAKKRGKGAGKAVSSEEEGKSRKKQRKGAGAKGGGKASGAAPLSESGLAAVLPSLAGMTHPADVLDMPVDPNEPTYCLCHQVSYGEMIGCDNLECPIEWFHFACVGLTTKPKGKWFCPKCSADRKKK